MRATLSCGWAAPYCAWLPADAVGFRKRTALHTHTHMIFITSTSSTGQTYTMLAAAKL